MYIYILYVYKCRMKSKHDTNQNTNNVIRVTVVEL